MITGATSGGASAFNDYQAVRWQGGEFLVNGRLDQLGVLPHCQLVDDQVGDPPLLLEDPMGDGNRKTVDTKHVAPPLGM
jgi:hypothetical protein